VLLSILHSFERVLTTHAGSLARPSALLDLIRAHADGDGVEGDVLAEAQRQAVAEVVAKQRAAGWTSSATESRARPGSSPTSASG
jgi:methionine synthase II (cobalamin-independent)